MKEQKQDEEYDDLFDDHLTCEERREIYKQYPSICDESFNASYSMDKNLLKLLREKGGKHGRIQETKKA